MRRLTLPLIIWALIVVNVPVIAFVTVASILEPRGSVWSVIFLVLPAMLASVVTGLISALGAYLGRRFAARGGVVRPAGRATAVGAGIGAAAAGTLPLGSLLSIIQGGPGVVGHLICAVLLFVAFTGFAAWWLRRAPRSATPAAIG